MPRRPRLAAEDLAYHVLNRRVGRPSIENVGAGGWRNDSSWNRRFSDENGRKNSDTIGSASFRRPDYDRFTLQWLMRDTPRS